MAERADIRTRPATVADATAIAELHVAVWRDTYRELAPIEAFRALDAARRQARWTAALAEPGHHQLVLVAEQGDRLVGIGAVGAPSQAAFEGRGEIRSLYVDPAIKRQGLGRRLMAKLAEHLAGLHYPGAALGVVVGNDPAIAFYQSLGGRMIGRYTDPGPIWRSDNIIIAWDDLSLLM
ncbi:GNAT family N-acetyltransferase [Rhizobium jaguaris]|uniref:GNAT family N-acetyltransferase n=1 Tax=Rhizobium jaguaris TaxID=1312183 RepID=A0A387FLU1_9HYPH|nr:GNAT family N-acetyltransferase [Rhizobium jaguaris]AYG59399.1 GNAT family N-acetyltransferase [Rhizobium jaguaris]